MLHKALARDRIASWVRVERECAIHVHLCAIDGRKRVRVNASPARRVDGEPELAFGARIKWQEIHGRVLEAQVRA